MKGQDHRLLRVGHLPALTAVLMLGGMLTSACSDDDTAGPGAGIECDAERPCTRTQVCEGGRCVTAGRCPEDVQGLSSECPETDADGDPLFCEYGFCVEECKPGPEWCRQPDYRCDQGTHTCVRINIDGRCSEHRECPEGEVCKFFTDAETGVATGQCVAGSVCASDEQCVDSTYGEHCHPEQFICVLCLTDDDCPLDTRPHCETRAYTCVPEPVDTGCIADIECCPPEVEACGRTCDPATLVCREPTVCTGDFDCNPGRYCQLDEGTGGGICRDMCTAPGAVCPPDKPECNQNTGRCERKSCQGDAECQAVMGERARCVDDKCVVTECEDDDDCAEQGFDLDCGVTCDIIAAGFGICKEPRECGEPGRAGCCRENRVCDVDPYAGFDYVHCQDPCTDRREPVCPQDGYCDLEGGSGRCIIVDPERGCFTSEMCPDEQECVREPRPQCFACAVDLCCRDNAECLEDTFCVDDRCVEIDPVFCEDSGNCPGRQVCSQAGACALDAPCEGDADCPGRLLCDPAVGRCDECTDNEDCLAAGTGKLCGDAPSGRYKICLEETRGFCTEDDACVGERTCESGFCEPAPCDDDWMHVAFHREANPRRGDLPGNHVPSHAAPIGNRSLTGLQLCDGQEDWFAIYLEQGQDAEAIVTYDPNAAGTLSDLKLELREGNAVLARSDGFGGTERVGINGAPFAGTYLLRVFGNPGANAAYKLDVQIGEICVDDPFEGPEGNNELANARAVEPGMVPDLILCAQGSGSSIDWYRLDLVEGTDLQLMVSWDINDGALTGGLFDSDRAEVVPGAEGAGGGSLTFDVVNWEGGLLYLQVEADDNNDAELKYDVRVLATCSDEQRQNLCDAATPLPLAVVEADNEGHAVRLAVPTPLVADLAMDPGLTNCWVPTCDPEADIHVAKEKIWRLDTTDPQYGGRAVDLTIHYNTDDPEFSGIVEVRGDCLDAAAVAGCRLDPRRRAYRIEGLPPDVYYLIVDGRGESAGRFEMEVQVQIAELPNECDSCLQRCVMGLAEDAEGNPTPQFLQFAAWQEAGEGRYQAELRHFTDRSQPHDQPMAADACLAGINGPERAPDTVYEFSTPEGFGNDRCRFSARLSPDGYEAGLVLTNPCPADEVVSCIYTDQVGASVLFVEELPVGDYALWVKGGGALHFGDFTLNLTCEDPDIVPPGDHCGDPAELELEEVLDRNGEIVLRYESEFLGTNIPYEDIEHLGGVCNAAQDPTGGDVVHFFNLPQRAAALFLNLEADFDAVVTLGRGCDPGAGADDPGHVAEEVACGSLASPVALPGPGEDGVAPGPFYIVVDGVDGDARGGYELHLTAIVEDVVRPLNDVCVDPADPRQRAHVLNFQVGNREEIDGDTMGANHDYSPRGCGSDDAGAADVVYEYTAEDPHRLYAQILGAHFQHNLYLRRGDCDLAEVACADGDLMDDQLELPPETYYLVVDGLREDDQGAFTLQVEWLPPIGVCNGNDDCARADQIALLAHPFEDGEEGLRGVIGAGSNAWCEHVTSPADCGVAGQEGRDVVYYFDLPWASTVSVRIQSAWVPVLYMRRAADAAACVEAAELYCDDNVPPEIAPEEALAPGRYYVFVDGAFVGEEGEFQLTVDAWPIAGAPENDNCEDVATHLTSEGAGTLVDADCTDDDEHPMPKTVCGLLDPYFDVDGDVRTIRVRATNEGALADYGILPADEEDETRCIDDVWRDTDVALDVVYAFTVEAPSSLVAEVTGIGGVERLSDAVLTLRGPNECADGAAEVMCGDEPATVERDDQDPLEPGTWFLIVDGFDETNVGMFQLDVTVETLAVRPDNDDCHPDSPRDALPIALEVAGDVATGEQQGSLEQTADDYQPVTCAEGYGLAGDVVYELELPFGYNEVRIDTVSDQDEELGGWPALVAYLRAGQPDCDVPDPPTCCHESTEVRNGCAEFGDFGSHPGIYLHFEEGFHLPGGTYYLVVDGYDGEDEKTRRATFTVNVQVARVVSEPPPGDTCDAVDIPDIEFAPDDPALAVVVYDGAPALGTTWAEDDVRSAACPGAEGGHDMVHRLRLDDDYNIDVTFNPVGWRGNVSIRSACDDAGTERACAPNVAGPVELTAGDYWIWVDGDGSGVDAYGAYSLTVRRTPVEVQPKNDTCAAVQGYWDLLPDNRDDLPPACQEDATRCGIVELADFADQPFAPLSGVINDLTANDDAGSCGGGGGDVVYLIDVVNPSVLTIDQRFHTMPTRLSLRTTCGEVATELACAAESIQTERLDVGQYYLWVDAFAPDGVGQFDISVAPDSAPTNDTCATPIELAIDREGRRSIAGNNGEAANDYAGTCGGVDGADVVYELPVGFRATLTVTVDGGAEMDAWAYLVSGNCVPAAGVEVADACGRGGFEVEHLAAGTYWLHVDGVADDDRGGFSVTVDAISEAPLNDLCGAAQRLPLSALQNRAVAAGRNTDGADDDQGVGDCANDAPDVFYTMNVDLQARDFQAYLTFDGEDAEEFDHVLVLRDACAGAAVGCSGANDKLILPDLAVGGYVLVVDGTEDGEDGHFELVVETPTPANSTCEGARALTILPDDPDMADDGLVVEQGSLVGAAKSYEMEYGDCEAETLRAGRDVVYELDVREPLDWLDLQVESPHFTPTVWWVADTCPAGDTIGCWIGQPAVAPASGFVAQTRVERVRAGRHYIFVDSGVANDLGDFTLTVTSGPIFPGPPNISCSSAEEIELNYVHVVPRTADATVEGTTLGSTEDYAPLVCARNADQIAEMGDTADVAYCVVIDTFGQETSVTISTAAREEGFPFHPVVYAYADQDAWGGSHAECTQDWSDACPGGQTCCPNEGELCLDHDGDDTAHCLTIPSCAEDELDATCEDMNGDGAEDNPVDCDSSFGIQAGAGVIEIGLPDEQQQVGDVQTHFKYYLVVDGIGVEGDFDLSVHSESMVPLCNGPKDAETPCNPDEQACCAAGTWCRCVWQNLPTQPPENQNHQDAACRPDGDHPTDPVCCDDNALNPPKCVECTEDADCPLDAQGNAQVCDWQDNLCNPGCTEDIHCEAPMFCHVPDGEATGQCSLCHADPDAVCATDDDCVDPDIDRDRFCQPNLVCSECDTVVGTNHTGYCSEDGRDCWHCVNDADCAGMEDAQGVPLAYCDTDIGTCMMCLPTVACDNAGDCGAGEQCVNNLCHQCPAGKTCADFHVCVECVTNADCGPGTFCAPMTFTCVQCLQNADCGAGFVCVQNRCQQDQGG